MKRAIILSLTMLFLTVFVPGLWAGEPVNLNLSNQNNLFLPLLMNEFTGELTGRWEGSLTSGGPKGCNPGALGLLLKQSGSLVTGTLIGIQISYADFANGVFAGTIVGPGQSWDLRFTLSADKQTLDGTIIVHKSGKADQTIPITFSRLSNDPTNPDPTPPTVKEITLSPSPPYVISIRWSKPIFGWNIELKTYIGGIFRTIDGPNLVECTLNTYNPQTYTYSMQISPNIVPDPGAPSTLSLCPGESDWIGAYGIPAWLFCGQATPVNFNWPNL